MKRICGCFIAVILLEVDASSLVAQAEFVASGSSTTAVNSNQGVHADRSRNPHSFLPPHLRRYGAHGENRRPPTGIRTPGHHVSQSLLDSVQEDWVRQYGSIPGNSDNSPNALAVDGSGNVYVTGYSLGTGTSYDYATIKYNSAGVQQWVALYNGPGNAHDIATALAVDGSSNVYVTGRSIGSGTADDYATIKYDSSGAQQWVARYNGPGNSFDIAAALAVDGQGNVVVTGWGVGSGTNYDYATVKYSSSGAEQWAARYNGPGNFQDYATALAIDGAGNIYVTGYSYGSGTNFDFATIKYDSAGFEEWVTRYNGAGLDDFAYALAIDNSGNVLVTGSTDALAGYATVKYDVAGVEQWAARYNGPGGDDEAYAVAADGSGSVYVTGRSLGPGTSYDYATVKYDGAGVEQWVARYNGLGNDVDVATSLVLDGSSSVYVTGWSGGLGTFADYATVKYSPTGVEQWVARYNGTGDTDDYALAIAMDSPGNIYVTGGSSNGPSSVFTTIKYTTNDPLSIQLTSFTATILSSSAVRLEWRTETETNNYGFMVQRAPDSPIQYQTLPNSFVPGNGTTLEPHDYEWIDQNASPGRWYYRLTQIDLDGAVHYTDGIQVDIVTGIGNSPSAIPKAYTLDQNYPNPFNPSTTIKYALPRQSHVVLTVYNILGQEVARLVDEAQDAGVKYVVWNATNLNRSLVASGVYFYRIEATSIEGTERFVQIRKLMLVK